MRILLITSRYVPHFGGLETVVRKISTEMRLNGHQVTIITNRWPRTLPKHEEIDQIPVTRFMFLRPQWSYLRTGRIDLLLAGIVFFPLTLVQLYAAVRRFKPDVVNLHYVGNQALFVWLLQRLCRFRLVVSLHGGDVDSEPYQSRFKRWLFCHIVSCAEQITACSQALLDQALLLAPQIVSKAHVIHNGVDVELFSQTPPYLHGRPYLFAVGRLEYHKGFDILISAFQQIADEYAEYDLLIAGDGSEYKSLEIQARACGGRISLLGATNPQRTASLMRGCVAVVIPSRKEPFGIVGLEAMAAGCPIVARSVGGLVEALKDSNTIWVEDEDPASMAAALKKMLANHNLPRSLVETNPGKPQVRSWQAVGRQYISTFIGT